MTAPTRYPKTGVYCIWIAIPPHLRAIVERDHGRAYERVLAPTPDLVFSVANSLSDLG